MAHTETERARLLFLIPTFNNVDTIDATIRSIWDLDYDKEQIFITVMDFGSVDGTFEKLQKYPSYHFGVYQNKSTKNRRHMVSRMAEICGYIYPGGLYCFMTVLYPGDVVYPSYARICSDSLIDNQALKPAFLICEADIIDDEGNVIKQESLFPNDCIIDGYSQMTEYVKRGYRHQIQCMKYSFGVGLHRGIGEMNEGRWWNKCAREALELNVIYIHTPLILERQIKYDDELEEILLRWESFISQVRTYEGKFGRNFDDDYAIVGTKNLSEYAIWRSFLLAKKDKKAAEDCLLIAGVINSEAKNKDIYHKMCELIRTEDKDIEDYLRKYFENNGMV